MKGVLAAFAAAVLMPTNDQLLAPTTACRVGSSTEMLCLHQYARRKVGVARLSRSAAVFAWAGKKADRIRACEFSHNPCGDPFTAAPGFSYLGENLAYGHPSIRATFAAWLRSPGHRTNILNADYRYYGSAYRRSYPRLWVVQFAS